jgi:hypothetical protein
MNIIIAFWRARGCWCCMTISPRPHLMVVERWQTTSTYTSLLDFSYFGGNISLVGWCMGQILNLTRTFRVMRNCASEWRSYPSHDAVVGRLWFHILLYCRLEIQIRPHGSPMWHFCTRLVSLPPVMRVSLPLFTTSRSAIIRQRLRISKTFLAGHSQSV